MEDKMVYLYVLVVSYLYLRKKAGNNLSLLEYNLSYAENSF